MQASDGSARTGILRTARGEIRTPVFMPVGTKGTVKTLHPDEVRDLGAQILLGNTYHLHFRPGDELIRDLGGLHRFMAWDAPILTDSGGFQVFSLRDTIAKVDDDGVTFKACTTVPPRASRPSSPRRSSRTSAATSRCASTRCPPRTSRGASSRRRSAARPSGRERQRHAPRAEGQLRFGITQGGVDAELRRRSTEEIAELDFDGNAIGGLAIGEDRARCSRRPTGRPR